MQSSAGVDQDFAQPSHISHPSLGQVVGGDGGRHTVLLGQPENLSGGVEDSGDPGFGPLEVEAFLVLGVNVYSEYGVSYAHCFLPVSWVGCTPPLALLWIDTR